MSDDLIGRVVAQRFRLESTLGQGGMGAVYRAVDTSATTEVHVAVKVIRESLAESPEAIARFEREVSATQALAHDNIVKFIAAGQDGGLRYLAMELLEGRTVKQLIGQQGAMNWRTTLPVLRGIVSALQAAHAHGLIHRDLKPENVFLVDGPAPGAYVVKLLDFGVAKHTALPDGMTMTGTGIIVGTPGFVAPEVVLKGVSDNPRSDFYGLGATWFEMLTGSKPFTAATPFALAMRHLNETPPRPTELLPFSPVPLPVESLLFALLEKSPEKRPKDAAELLQCLDVLESGALGTPLPSHAQQESMSHLMRTITDMQTPRPALLAPDGHAALSARASDPDQRATATSVRAFEEPAAARVAPPRRRGGMLVIGAAVVLVVLLTLKSALGLHLRVGVDNAADAGMALDAGVWRDVVVADAGAADAAVADAGASAVDAGAGNARDAGVNAGDAGPRVRKPREPKEPKKPVLDLPPAGK